MHSCEICGQKMMLYDEEELKLSEDYKSYDYKFYNSFEDHNADHMTKIVDDLYLGGMNNARNSQELKHFGINAIINGAMELTINSEMKEKYDYTKFEWDDTIEFSNTKEFSESLEIVADTIHSKLKSGLTVLVHCFAGISRSTSAILAYLIKYKKMTYTAAFEMVQKVRPIIKPNPGFIQQLRDFKDYLDLKVAIVT